MRAIRVRFHYLFPQTPEVASPPTISNDSVEIEFHGNPPGAGLQCNGCNVG